MKVDYICTQWPLGPDNGPSAASRPASCVLLISYCFSQREGHLLIDCLNPLQINTAGSLCDAYPSSPHLSVSAAGQRGQRKRDSIKSALTSEHGHCLWPPHSLHCLRVFMSISDNRSVKQNGLGDPRWAICTPQHIDALYELWNESGLPNLTARLRWHFSTLFIILTAGVLRIDK